LSVLLPFPTRRSSDLAPFARRWFEVEGGKLERSRARPPGGNAGALNFRLTASKQVGYRIALTWSGRVTRLYAAPQPAVGFPRIRDRKSTRLNSSHQII